MKNTFKITKTLLLAIFLITFSCSEDDPVNIITLEDFTTTIDENPSNGQVIGAVEVMQTVGGGTLVFSITSQTPSGALNIDSSSGELTVANASLFDFETNPIISATIEVEGATNTASVTININNLEAMLQNLTVSIDENPNVGDTVGTVQTNATGVSNFNISAQTPSGALSIDAISGELTVADATLFDFETNPTITATVTDAEATNNATVTVNITNVSEVTVDDLIVAIDENPSNGDVVGTVLTSGGAGGTNFMITSQTPSGALNIDSATGELSVADSNIFDYETNPTITASITVDDGIAPGSITINLNNVSELSVQDFSATIDENPSNGDAIGTVQAVGDGTLNYSISSQTPAGALNIDANSGELSVADATLFNFETNPTLTASIQVTNTGNSETLSATINLNNINEIGDFNHGGIVFWVDPADNNNGLVVAVSNQFYTGTWGCSGTNTGATGTAIGTGGSNTSAIVNSGCAPSGSIVEIVANLSLNGYNDWFVPSEGELLELFANITVVNAAITANGGQVTYQFHWSSTEINSTAARLVNLTTGAISGSGKNSLIYFTKPVRAF